MRLPERYWRSCLFPHYHWTQVPPTEVQQALAGLFAWWGRPERIRVDNGAPWATWSDLPPALALWWVGLGITPVWNRAYSPTQNARVERCNGLVNQWGEPRSCADFPGLAARLAWVAETQRERYPACSGRTRAETYPELQQNPRACTDADAEFRLERVTGYLGAGRWPRLVSKIGQIHLYGKPYRVGRKWTGQEVWVRLDPATTEWVIETETGAEIVRHPAEQLTEAKIKGLQVAQPRPPSRKRPRQNLAADVEP